MKVKFLFAATVVALFIASCGGVDKQLVDNITKFETDWTGMVKDVATMSETMATDAAATMKECDEECSKECKDKKMQPKMDSIKMSCNMSKDGMTAAMANVTSFKADLDKATTDFTAWKDKVMKGEVKGEEATKALADYQTKMNESKDQMKALQEAFDRSKKDCMDMNQSAKDCCEKKM